MHPAAGAPSQIKPIEPSATETATRLLGMTESMLGWRASLANLDQREETVRRYILSQYPLLGRAPNHQEIAAAFRLNGPAEVRAILERLHERDLLYLDPDSREVRLAYPFSTSPTKHLVRFQDWAEAQPLYAPCAVDALGIPFMIDRDVSIESSCAYCAMPVAIKVRNRRIEVYVPVETVVWVGTAYSEHAATSICPTLDFFCSPTHVAAWRETRPEERGHELSLGEALYLAKGIFQDLLNPRDDAMSSTFTAIAPARSSKPAMTVSSAGGLLAAFLASACCIGPLIFAALGVGIGATGFLAGTAGVLKALLPYRPLFIGLTILLLGVAFYLAYRKPKSLEAARETCVPASGSLRKTSLAEDDAQICAVPNVAWAAVKAGHKVTILVDASAVTSVTKGFGRFRKLTGTETTALDRAGLPERERQSLSEQMGVPLEQIPHNYGEYFDFLKDKLGVEIYGNRTMMLLYKIDPARVTSVVTPIPLGEMVKLFSSADRVIVY